MQLISAIVFVVCTHLLNELRSRVGILPSMIRSKDGTVRSMRTVGRLVMSRVAGDLESAIINEYFKYSFERKRQSLRAQKTGPSAITFGGILIRDYWLLTLADNRYVSNNTSLNFVCASPLFLICQILTASLVLIIKDLVSLLPRKYEFTCYWYR